MNVDIDELRSLLSEGYARGRARGDAAENVQAHSPPWRAHLGQLWQARWLWTPP